MAAMWVYVRKLYGYAGFRLPLHLIGMIAVSMLEGLNLFILVPLLSLIGLFDSAGNGLPFVNLLSDALQGLPATGKLAVILGLFVVIITLQAVLQRAQSDWGERIEQGYIRHLRTDIYTGLLQARWTFFLSKKRSDYLHILTAELPRVSFGIYQVLNLATVLLFTAVQVALAVYLSWPLTLCILACGLMLALLTRTYARQARVLGDEATALSETYYGGITEHLSGLKEIKSNRLERHHLQWFRALTSKMEKNVIGFNRVQSMSQFYYRLASGLLLALFLFLAVAVFRVPGERLVMIVIIFSRLWPKFASLQSGGEQLAQTLPAFASLERLERDLAAVREAGNDATTDSEHPLVVTGHIECRNVCYRYDTEAAGYTLDHIQLQIPAHSMTAIVGRSGAGKSTLIDLLIGLIEPEQGTVLVDGIPLDAKRALALRDRVGYVPQEPFLFHATLRENLRLAAPEATEDRMWEALRLSASEPFVRQLPQGLDTLLGDRGIRLSGGERQRIVLARALLRKPAILILDEATSALDSESEVFIQEALTRLQGSMTIIVIAHRLSTIRGADQVLVMDNGAIIQQGAYHQVKSDTDGMFSRLLQLQA
ncbi:ATP-binding cassette subfamily C protein [Paenibacillus phyllosphaerae]|uniref:ATP-binding cassette subfamily C protein n=1 Tax=Paenibacillus phyllosphaerae TaxID=274593 RepID=A0A7W5ATZ2_9BACL|nr:ABC transporter ATP-binding protein [Paenibacillus phyllosphaerae]MBB3108738.1 ATP-binding cassette subfamily C protein [Paenibacillus phyllosphaerae]